jgi:hypothetical protein
VIGEDNFPNVSGKDTQFVPSSQEPASVFRNGTPTEYGMTESLPANVDYGGNPIAASDYGVAPTQGAIIGGLVGTESGPISGECGDPLEC